MKKIIVLLSLFGTLLFSLKDNKFENDEAQNFFSASDVNAFFESSSGELLKKIMVDGHEYLMQQDGDLFDEDVATIDDEVFQPNEVDTLLENRNGF